MTEIIRLVAADAKTALTGAATTLRNDPKLQDWWLCVAAYLISAFLIGNIISDTWNRLLA